MGFFSKIKNFITGGAAEVAIIYEEPITDGSKPVKLFVTATANDDCKIKKVYLNFRARETYIKRHERKRTDDDGHTTTYHEDLTEHLDHFTKELILAEDIMLSKGQSDKWLAEIELPSSPIATFHGRDVFFKWEAEAGLDMPGNDPDSGWVELIVAKKMNYTINDIA
ncbi:MAG: hypothetical protein JXR10_00085 [Cyclobacteriaceae bacterium]